MEVRKLKVPKFTITSPSEVEKADLTRQLVKAINGGIEFGSPSLGSVNISGAWVVGVTPGVINTDFALTHNLGRIPTGWLLVWKDGYVDFKIGAGTWTSKQIFLQANVINVNYRVFVF